MQGLYQWQFSETPAVDIEAQFRVDFDMGKVDLEYFRDLVKGVQANAAELDEKLAAFCEAREIDEADPITKALLRLAAFELGHRIDVPYRVVIDEAVTLARKFGPEQSHSFVNAVLDKLARQERSAETGA